MKSSKLCGIAAALLLAATGASAADAVNPYVHSSSGQVVKNSTDLCWRSGFWTPALAEAMGIDGAGWACDAEILDKKKRSPSRLIRSSTLTKPRSRTKAVRFSMTSSPALPALISKSS